MTVCLFSMCSLEPVWSEDQFTRWCHCVKTNTTKLKYRNGCKFWSYCSLNVLSSPLFMFNGQYYFFWHGQTPHSMTSQLVSETLQWHLSMYIAMAAVNLKKQLFYLLLMVWNRLWPSELSMKYLKSKHKNIFMSGLHGWFFFFSLWTETWDTTMFSHFSQINHFCACVSCPKCPLSAPVKPQCAHLTTNPLGHYG